MAAGGGGKFLTFLRSHAVNIILVVMIAYYGIVVLMEISGGKQRKLGSADDKAPKDEGSSEAPPEAESPTAACKRSVYNWEKEDWRHARVKDDRKAYYGEVSIGRHNKILGTVSSNIQSLILQGFQPTISCADLERFGGVQDGGKVLCEATRLLASEDDCIVYSFGVGYDCKFEVDLLEHYPECIVHMFDPSMSMTAFFESHCAVHGTNFYPWGLRGEPLLPSGEAPPPVFNPNGTEAQDESTPEPVSRFKIGFYSLPRIQQELGHTGRKIQLIKMDIEGGEYDSLLYLMAPQNRRIMFDTNLLALEVHQAPPGYQEKLIAELEAHDMRLYYVERNPYYPAVLAEVAMLNSSALRIVDNGPPRAA